jgi:hypothetical protein
VSTSAHPGRLGVGGDLHGAIRVVQVNPVDGKPPHGVVGRRGDEPPTIAASLGSLAISASLGQIGFSVAIGVLMSTFVSAWLLIPALTTVLGRKAFWPMRTADPS